MKTKTMPKVSKFMTAMPHTIGNDIPVKKALEMMRTNNIRHLPVQAGGTLVGMISDRDIKLASSFQGAAELRVDDVMSPDPYTISPDAALDEVVATMAEHKYGSAVVQQDNSKVVGIFTAVDGLRVLADILRQNYRWE
jgi:acetoin utilization protein AcuB